MIAATWISISTMPRRVSYRLILLKKSITFWYLYKWVCLNPSGNNVKRRAAVSQSVRSCWKEYLIVLVSFPGPLMLSSLAARNKWQANDKLWPWNLEKIEFSIAPRVKVISQIASLSWLATSPAKSGVKDDNYVNIILKITINDTEPEISSWKLYGPSRFGCVDKLIGNIYDSGSKVELKSLIQLFAFIGGVSITRYR